MSSISKPHELLEVNIISAQDLTRVARKMRTYAVAWVRQDRKLSTRVDVHGGENPTWNDKFVFRVDDKFLNKDTAAIMVEIYAKHWFSDVHVGTVRVIIGNLIRPQNKSHHRQNHLQLGMRFVALQVRRRSGRPQGILNVGVALLDSSRRSMPLYKHLASSALGYKQLMGEEYSSCMNDINSNNVIDNQMYVPWIPKAELRRTKSDSSSMIESSSTKVTEKTRMMKTAEVKESSSVNGLEIDSNKNNNKETNTKMSKSKPGSTISVPEFVRKSNASYFQSSEIGGLAKAKYKSSESSTTISMSSSNPNPSRLGTPKKTMFPGGVPMVLEPSSSTSEMTTINIKKNYNNNNNQLIDHENESEIMGEWNFDDDSREDLRSKLATWRVKAQPMYDYRGGRGDSWSSVTGNYTNEGSKSTSTTRRRRQSTYRKTNEDDGMFSCFSNICGLECSIACGGASSPRKSSGGRRVKRTSSLDTYSFV